VEILELRLNTYRLDDMQAFYVNMLDLPLVQRDADHLIVQAGRTRLVFAGAQSECSYHFAFNIPENQFAEAKTWLSQRTSLLKFQGNDEIHWTAWNAHALYFYDPAGNVLELIARHSLPNGSQSPFSGRSLCEVSEIGLAVENVEQAVATLQAQLGLGVWDAGDGQTFTALGDELGLLILVKRGRAWFPTTDRAADFCPVALTARGRTTGDYQLEGTPYQFRVTNDNGRLLVE
jgi:catechol-2,3-dioxygenase